MLTKSEHSVTGLQQLYGENAFNVSKFTTWTHLNYYVWRNVDVPNANDNADSACIT